MCVSVVQEIEQGPALDAVIIGAMQKTEHYCIAAWGTAKSLAQAVGNKTATRAMDRALKEGKGVDEKLTQLAEKDITPALLTDAETKKTRKLRLARGRRVPPAAARRPDFTYRMLCAPLTWAQSRGLQSGPMFLWRRALSYTKFRKRSLVSGGSSSILSRYRPQKSGHESPTTTSRNAASPIQSQDLEHSPDARVPPACNGSPHTKSSTTL